MLPVMPPISRSTTDSPAIRPLKCEDECGILPCATFLIRDRPGPASREEALTVPKHAKYTIKQTSPSRTFFFFFFFWIPREEARSFRGPAYIQVRRPTPVQSSSPTQYRNSQDLGSPSIGEQPPPTDALIQPLGTFVTSRNFGSEARRRSISSHLDPRLSTTRDTNPGRGPIDRRKGTLTRTVPWGCIYIGVRGMYLAARNFVYQMMCR